MAEFSGLNSLLIFPNPSNDFTNIVYDLDKSSNVKIEIYNIIGKKVTEIINKKQQPGHYKYQFSAKALGYSEGLYLFRFKVNGNEIVRKLVEVK